MRKDKEDAIKLRSSGKSYSEISSILSVPKSTLSAWLSNQQWSKDVGLELARRNQVKSTVVLKELAKVRGAHLKKLYEQAESEANDEFDMLKYHPLFISAMMIYWGEGDKLSRNRISVVNTDPNLLKVFVLFLKRICGFDESKIRAWILAYPDLDTIQIKSFWSDKIGIDESSFRKTIIIKGKATKRKLSNGVCTVELSSTYFKIKMLVWLRRFSEALISDEYYAGVV